MRLSPAQLVQPKVGEASKVSPVAPQSTLQVADLREEYGYVIADLKRIGIIAVVMLAALIVLALVWT